jgi:hypothetical protein
MRVKYVLAELLTHLQSQNQLEDELGLAPEPAPQQGCAGPLLRRTVSEAPRPPAFAGAAFEEDCGGRGGFDTA